MNPTVTVEQPLIDFRPALLVVDDEHFICSAIERIFERQGIKVHKAYNALEGLERLANVDVQVVISDFQMPGHDGAWFLSQVRLAAPRVQRVLLTAGYKANVDDLQRSINEGGVHRFLTKPWSNEHLVRTVQECIDQWRILAERDHLLGALEETNRVLESKVEARTRDIERASREWRRTFDAIADPLTLVDAGLRINRANLAAASAAELDIRTLIGRRCHEALFGRESACEGCPLAASPGGVAGANVEIVDERNGRTWKVTTWPLAEAGESPAPVEGENVAVCHYEDITEERELQKQMLMLEKIAAIGELAGCVAHELNNPLTGILSFSQVLARLTEQTDPDTFVMANEIEEAARRCRNIVQALLDYARPSGHIDFADIDLRDLIDGVVRVSTLTQSQHKRVEILREEPVDLWPVRGVADGLKSVFMNLINNAVQAIDGPGTLRIRAENLPGEHMVRIRVSDSGPGIPPALREKIFQPFFTTKAQNKSGTGLGLAIVRNVVRDHGGSVSVGEGPEGGACFDIRLPAAIASTRETP